jgi:hypothetical protein
LTITFQPGRAVRFQHRRHAGGAYSRARSFEFRCAAGFDAPDQAEPLRSRQWTLLRRSATGIGRLAENGARLSLAPTPLLLGFALMSISLCGLIMVSWDENV